MTPRRPLGSVLIPAHNESAVIGRCLSHLFDGIDDADLEVAVVCNGCHDDTAAVARASGHPVEVIELSVASKPAALRAGDRLLRAFPRLYVDADVVVAGSTVRRVLEHLAKPDSLAARPPLRYETAHCSPIVRRYYHARSRVPAVMGSMWGAGLYGLSASGRSRFSEFPDVVADDLFVDQCFDRGEIAIVGDEPVVVMAPGHLRDLLRVMRRTYRGTGETQTACGSSATNPTSTTPTTSRDVLKLCRSVPGLVDAATYAFVAIAARAYVALGRPARWERDESSRTVTAAAQDAGSGL